MHRKRDKKKGILFWITGLPGSGKTNIARKINNQIIIVCLKTDGGHILIFIFDIFSHAFVCLFELSVIYVLASPPGFWGMVLYKKR